MRELTMNEIQEVSAGDSQEVGAGLVNAAFVIGVIALTPAAMPALIIGIAVIGGIGVGMQIGEGLFGD